VPRHRQHIEAHQPVHAGDADRRQQRPDRGRDQTDEERDQHHHRHRTPGIGGKARDRHGGEDKDQGHPGEQNIERDLVRRLLPHRTLDERDHAVEKGRALRGGDPHLEPIRGNAGASGHCRAVAAALADDRRRLAGDRRFVDRGHTLDDLAVARDQVAGFDQHQVARSQRRGVDEVERARLRAFDALRLGLGPGSPQGVGLRLAAALGDGFGEIGEQHREPQPERDLPGKERAAADHLAGADKEVAQEEHGRQHRDDLDAKHHRVFDESARIELFERGPDRRHDQRAVEQHDRADVARNQAGWRHADNRGKVGHRESLSRILAGKGCIGVMRASRRALRALLSMGSVIDGIEEYPSS
jgi:hypothetical protein